MEAVDTVMPALVVIIRFSHQQKIFVGNMKHLNEAEKCSIIENGMKSCFGLEAETAFVIQGGKS